MSNENTIKTGSITRDEVRAILDMPNGSEQLFNDPRDSLKTAWELFLFEASPSACAFLCRMAKRKIYREHIEQFLSDDTRLPLCKALLEGAPKLRKNTARLMGTLKNSDDAAALINALKNEKTLFVVPSIILALGAIGGDASQNALVEYKIPFSDLSDPGYERHKNDIMLALKTALDSFSAQKNSSFLGLKTTHAVELRIPLNMGAPIKNELMRLGYPCEIIGADRLKTITDDYTGIFRVRSFSEALLPAVSECLPTPQAVADACREHFISVLNEVYGSERVHKYRIEVKCSPGINRTVFINKLSDLLDRSPSLSNSASAYDSELRVEFLRNNSACSVYIKFCAFNDSRFDYRAKTIPASIHPHTASAVLRYAGNYLKPGASVLDFCCGSGTMLLEREKITPCSRLVGVDISKSAIEAASINSKSAGTDVQLLNINCLRYNPRMKFDEVIANMPFGNRVGTHNENERLYYGISDKLTHWLKVGGIAVLYTTEGTLLKRTLRATQGYGIEILSETTTRAGGLFPRVFVLRITNANDS